MDQLERGGDNSNMIRFKMLFNDISIYSPSQLIGERPTWDL